MNKSFEVYLFGEKSPDNKWYAGKDGVRIKCGEETIDHLWQQWVMNLTVKRSDADGYNIFEVHEPPMNLM